MTALTKSKDLNFLKPNPYVSRSKDLKYVKGKGYVSKSKSSSRSKSSSSGSSSSNTYEVRDTKTGEVIRTGTKGESISDAKLSDRASSVSKNIKSSNVSAAEARSSSAKQKAIDQEVRILKAARANQAAYEKQEAEQEKRLLERAKIVDKNIKSERIDPNVARARSRISKEIAKNEKNIDAYRIFSQSRLNKINKAIKERRAKEDKAIAYLDSKLNPKEKEEVFIKSIIEKNSEFVKSAYNNRIKTLESNLRLAKRTGNKIVNTEFIQANIKLIKKASKELDKISKTDFAQARKAQVNKNVNFIKKASSNRILTLEKNIRLAERQTKKILKSDFVAARKEQVSKNINLIEKSIPKRVETFKKNMRFTEVQLNKAKNSEFVKEYKKNLSKDYDLLLRKSKELSKSQFVKELNRNIKKDYDILKKTGANIAKSKFVAEYKRNAIKDYELAKRSFNKGIEVIGDSKVVQRARSQASKNIKFLKDSNLAKNLKREAALNVRYLKNREYINNSANYFGISKQKATQLLQAYQKRLEGTPSNLTKAQKNSEWSKFLNEIEKKGIKINNKENKAALDSLKAGFIINSATIVKDIFKYKSREDVQDAVDLINKPVSTITDTAAFIKANPSYYLGEIGAEYVFLGGLEGATKKIGGKSKKFLSAMAKAASKTFGKKYLAKKGALALSGAYTGGIGTAAAIGNTTADVYKVLRAGYLATTPIKRGETKAKYNARIDNFVVRDLNINISKVKKELKLSKKDIVLAKKEVKKNIESKKTKKPLKSLQSTKKVDKIKTTIDKKKTEINTLKTKIANTKNKKQKKQLQKGLKLRKNQIIALKTKVKLKEKLKEKQKSQVKGKEKLKEKQKQKQKQKEKLKEKIKEKEKFKEKQKQKLKEEQKQKQKQKQKAKVKVRSISKLKKETKLKGSSKPKVSLSLNKNSSKKVSSVSKAKKKAEDYLKNKKGLQTAKIQSKKPIKKVTKKKSGIKYSLSKSQ
jgi:hypothetical protein